MKKVAVIGLGGFGFSVVKTLAKKKDVEILGAEFQREVRAADLLRRPEFDYADVASLSTLLPSKYIRGLLPRAPRVSSLW